MPGSAAPKGTSPTRAAWQSTGVHRADVLVALGVFQRATGEQLWRMLRPHHRHDRITRDTLNELRRRGMVRAESRLPSGHQLWVLTPPGHAEAKAMLPPGVRMSALRRPAPAAAGRARGAGGFDAHAAAVTSTAAHLIGAGFGTVLSCQTEVPHKLPYGYVQYCDLVVRAPAAGVPALLVEVDRATEPVHELVAKVRRYAEWFEVLAPKADAEQERYARRYGGEVHQYRLWPLVYPATGREGYPPLVFVFAGATAAQRASRIARLADGARAFYAGRPYGGGFAAVNYHQAVPVVAVDLEDLDAHGAAGAVWQRLGRDRPQTLADALDNPDGDRLHRVEWAAAERRREEKAAAEREARRPRCTRCAEKFSDERWQEVRQHSGGFEPGLCGRCRDAEADRLTDERLARQAAQQAAAAAAAQAEADAARGRGLFRRPRR